MDNQINVIKFSAELASGVCYPSMLCHLERYGRVCYKSEHKITPTTAEPFVRSLIQRGHESVLEHVSVTIRIICDRGVTHELVRHRIAAYSQESTRYCDYTGLMTFISTLPHMTQPQYEVWYAAMQQAAAAYNQLRELECSPQMARSVLPNSLKTEIVATMNIREWRHVLRLRTSKAAHPQMRDVADAIFQLFHKEMPLFVEDIDNESRNND